MNREVKLNELVNSLAIKSYELLNNIQAIRPQQFLHFHHQTYSLVVDCFILIAEFLKKPHLVQQIQTEYGKDVFFLSQTQALSWVQWQLTFVHSKPLNPANWVDSPLLNTLNEHHQLFSKHFRALLELFTFKDKIFERRIKFFLIQVMDALSPNNYLFTNPELIFKTIQTQGQNLLSGLDNLLNDIEIDSSHLLIHMLEKREFEIGVNLATTPGKIIYRNEMMELIQYIPQTPQVYSIPLLIVPPWINKYYILDLSPDNSFIAWIVRQGFSVFSISWVNPDINHAKKGFEDYLIEGTIEAISVIQKQLQVNQVNLLGFCIGGTLVACTLAYLKAINQNVVGSATFLASLIDFSDPGDISAFISVERIQELERLMQLKGYLDGRIMANAFNLLRPKDLFWSFFTKNYLHGEKTPLFDILYWNADLTNMPEKMLSEYLHEMYLNNHLIKPNKLHLNKVPLNINQITLPTFFVATKKDHIAPWQSVYQGFATMRGEKIFLLGESGHIAGIINPPENKKYGYYLNLNSHSNSEAWLKNSNYKAGSWWLPWIKWLKKKSGKKKSSLFEFDKLPFKMLAEAPGLYVHKSYKKR